MIMLLHYKNIIFSILFIMAISGLYVYLDIGIRTDHILIYSLAVYIVVTILLGKTSLNLNIPSLLIIGFIVGIILIGFSANLISNIQLISPLTLIASVENYLQPIALMLISSYLVSQYQHISSEKIIVNLINIYLIFLVFNTLLTLVFFYIGPGDYLDIIGGPGRGSPDHMSVIERALEGGRNSGVFNQPIEGGTALSIGIFAWIYLYKLENKRLDNIWFCLQFFIIFIGGILSGSKVFIIGMSVISMFYLLPLRNYKNLIKIKFIFCSTLIPFVFIILPEYWNDIGAIPIDKGLIYVKRLFIVDTWHDQYQTYNFFDIYLSHRFSGEINIWTKIIEVILISPLIGNGFGTILSSDNAVLEIASVSGLLGLGLYLGIFLCIYILSLRKLKDNSQAAGLLLSIWLLLAATSLGAPIITANRVSIIVWILTFLLLSMLCENKLNIHRSKIFPSH